MVAVAALQFASGTEVEENLASCLRLLDEAVERHRPQLVVLPAFCNHPPYYEDREHARRVALRLDGAFLGALGQRAARHGLYIALHASLLRDDRLTVAHVLLGPDGAVAGLAETPHVPRHLWELFREARDDGPFVADTPFGRLGCYALEAQSGLDARALTLAGAELLCVHGAGLGPLLAIEEAEARAGEDLAGVVVANQNLPRDRTEQARCGGQSCVAAPGGGLLSSASTHGEAVVYADLVLAAPEQRTAHPALALRRPELYRDPGRLRREVSAAARPPNLSLALLSAPPSSAPEEAAQRVAEQVRALARQGVSLVLLPELFCFEGGAVSDPAAAAAHFVPVVRRLSEACAASGTHVVTSLVEQIERAYFHMGVVVGQAGLVARQAQLHVPARHAWARRGRRLTCIRMPWGHLVVAVGEDGLMSELLQVCADFGASLVVRPAGPLQPFELTAAPRVSAGTFGFSMAVAGREPGHRAVIDAAAPWRAVRLSECDGGHMFIAALGGRIETLVPDSPGASEQAV